MKRVAPRSLEKGTRLVIVDDNALMREGLALVLREQEDLTVVGSTAETEDALRMVRERKPQIALVDAGLGDDGGVLFTRTVCRDDPDVKVVVMGVQALEEDAAQWVHAGAGAFVMKDATIEEFVATIRRVMAGEKVLPPELTGSLFTAIAAQTVRVKHGAWVEEVRLTQRERQIVDLIAEGLSNKDIAMRLNIAVHTVKSHVHNVLEKLELRTRLELAAHSRTDGRRT